MPPEPQQAKAHLPRLSSVNAQNFDGSLKTFSPTASRTADLAMHHHRDRDVRQRRPSRLHPLPWPGNGDHLETPLSRLTPNVGENHPHFLRRTPSQHAWATLVVLVEHMPKRRRFSSSPEGLVTEHGRTIVHPDGMVTPCPEIAFIVGVHDLLKSRVPTTSYKCLSRPRCSSLGVARRPPLMRRAPPRREPSSYVCRAELCVCVCTLAYVPSG